MFDEEFQKQLEVLSLVSRRVFEGRSRAERRTRKVGAGIEFADYRAYYPGDDYRQIDWNVYGRAEKLMLRLHEQEEDLSVYLLLDCSGSMAFGSPRKLDYAKQLAAALAYIALNHLDRVALVGLRGTELQRLAPARGQKRIFGVFEFLTGLSAGGPTRLSESIGAFVAQHKRRGVAILISDLYDPAGFEEGVNRLRYARFETHVLHLVDRADAHPTLHGDVELFDAETGETRAVTVTPQLVRRYEQAYAAYSQRITSACLQQRVGLFTLDTSVPFEQAMLRILQRGGLVA